MTENTTSLQTVQSWEYSELRKPGVLQRINIQTNNICAVLNCDSVNAVIPANSCDIRYHIDDEFAFRKVRDILFCKFHGVQLPAELSHRVLDRTTNYHARAQLFQCHICNQPAVFTNVGCKIHGNDSQTILLPCIDSNTDVVTDWAPDNKENRFRVDNPLVVCTYCAASYGGHES